MDIEEAALSASESVGKIVDGYMDRVRTLKSQLQNDAASVRASCEKIEKDYAKVTKAMSGTVASLTSPEMERAITNAERLAAALTSINAVKENHVVLSVGASGEQS